MSYEKATILSTLSKIQNGELVLPAIQRDFVWEPERMYKLLDSIFRGYPFSTLLFWNTKQRVQYREFTKEWSSDYHFTFQVKQNGKKGTMVLDGQQRLQTIYLAIYGSYDQKVLYFDLLSGIEPDDKSQAKYNFEYLSLVEAELQNDQQAGIQHWVPLRDLANLSGKQLTVKTIQYLTKLNITGDSESGQRLSQNMSAAFNALRVEETLNYFTIDKEYGDDGLVTNLDEVLEIFVRVNSGGQVLTKSDLMFSLMQMLWEGAADSIADLTDRLNAKEHYDFDKDFILKAALVCTNHGARYEVDKLRNKTNVKEIEKSFPKISEALLNCKDFVVSKARFLDDRILRSYNTLIPFVYFFYLQPNQQVKNEETLMRMNHALYLSLMTALYSRLADNYIDQVVNNIIIPYHKKNPGQFPLSEYLAFMKSKQGRSEFDDLLLQNNIGYLMNILEGGTRLPEGRRSHRPEVDHIFPRSKLQELGIPEERINHYANFRLISQPENNWKRAQDPQPYFKANPKAAKRYYIPTDLLTYKQFEKFLKERRELIWHCLVQFFGLDQRSEPAIPNPDEPAEQVADAGSGQQLPSMSLLEYCRANCSNHLLTQPTLKDNSRWWDIMPDWYGQIWRRNYAASLERQGVRTVSDLALLITVLKLRIAWVEDGYPHISFDAQGPDGVRVKFQRFQKWGWRMILWVMEQRGFNWREFVANPEMLDQVRNPMD
jgi:hypothetical protein